MQLLLQAGVLGLTKTVAKEFSGRNITCNAIAPGFIASDMTAKIDKKYEEAILKQIPLGMPGCPGARPLHRTGPQPASPELPHSSACP